jgi:hypothetical protein
LADDAGEETPFQLESGRPPARRGKRRRRAPGWLTGLIWLALVGSVLASAVLAFQLLRERFTTSKKSDTVDWIPEDQKFNFRLTVRRGEWKEDAAARHGLRAFFALENTRAPLWLAVAAQAFATRDPRDAELEAGAVERLRNYFTDSDPEWEPVPSDDRLAGRPAQRIVFQAEHDKVLVRGECDMIRYRGIGYWVFLWAPAGRNKKWETTHRALAELQASPGGGFALLDARKGWEERPPETDRFRGAKHRFSVRCPKGQWQQYPAAAEDPDGDLYLQRIDPEKPNDPARGVNVLVLALPRKPGTTWKTAMRDAQEHLLRRQPVVGDEKPKLKPAYGRQGESGAGRKIGNVRGRVADLKVATEGLTNFASVAVVLRAGHVFVIQCQCRWDDRTRWRGEFNQMLDTFELREE